MAGVRAVVAPPRLAPARFGLLQSFTPVGEGERWQGGFSWEPESCGVGGTIAPCDDTDDLKDIPADDNPSLATFEPFVIWDGHRCSTFGGLTEDRQQRARNLLAASQSRKVEAELYNGTLATAEDWDNNFLRNSASLENLSPSGSSPLVYGLAALEEALAECTGRGVIHATVQTATLWQGAQVVRREGNLLLTALDTIVVAGAGYSGASPAGSVDASGATAWAYATGLVDVRLDQVVVFGDETTIDRRRNTWEVRAERLAAATFDPCCHFGINVDLCSTFCEPEE